MGRIVRFLLKEFFEVFRWREEWNFFDYVDQTLRGKAMLTAVGGLLTITIAVLTKHPWLVAGAVGVVGNTVIIIAWDYIRQTAHNTRQLPPKPTFRKFPLSSSLGSATMAFTELEHKWSQCNEAYKGFTDAWNRMSDVDSLKARKELSVDDQKHLFHAQARKLRSQSPRQGIIDTVAGEGPVSARAGK